uniref:C2H2-type domain-containing protein n=1 Tax=Heligmosomoides polygyrus TaxID=6339 RepID=A0A183GJU9_HELPZ
LTSTCSAVRRKDQIGDEQWEVDSGVSAKRAPVLADEGVGTFVITKLPLAEMTMSTRALRAIQEDHVLAKAQSQDEELQCRVVKHELVAAKSEHSSSDAVSSEASTSNARKSTANNKTQCKYCRKWFAAQVTLNRHVREEHPEPNYMKGTTIECGDPHCDVVCDRMSTLCEHVAQEHGREDLVIEEFNFPSAERFKEWKDQVETDTMSKYVLSSSRMRNSGVLQSYYLCHLSGYANRSRHSVVSGNRFRSTKKLGRYCTAFINTRESPGGDVTVHCCLGHFGHSFDVRRLPLPRKVKDEVSELLMKGNDPQQVHEMVRKKYTASERGFYLKRYEVRNIADKLRKNGLISPKEKEAIIGPCGYEEYRDGDEYEEVDVMVGDVDEEGNAVTYFIEETHPSRNVLDAIHSVRSGEFFPIFVFDTLTVRWTFLSSSWYPSFPSVKDQVFTQSQCEEDRVLRKVATTLRYIHHD